MSKHTILHKGLTIEYELTQKSVKYLNLRINAQGKVSVSAPKYATLQDVEDFVQSRADWVITHIAKAEQRKKNLPSREVFDGKTVYFLGKPYVLRISQGPRHIAICGETIHVHSLCTQEDGLRAEYLQWLMYQAKRIFPAVLEEMYPFVVPYGIPNPRLTIRNMRSIWGSCSPHNGSIRLNLQLIKADMLCIREVVCHELAHFRYPNHSKQFYDLLGEWMPNWAEARERLKTMYRDGI